MDHAPESERPDALTNVVGQWTLSNPVAALAWVRELPESERNRSTWRSPISFGALNGFKEHWDKFGAGLGIEKLEALGIEWESVRGAKFK